MEFPSLGEQCSNLECKQLDFTPLRCECGNFFCKNHFIPHCLSDDCPKAVKPKQKVSTFPNSIIYKCSFLGCKIAGLMEMSCLKCQQHFCIEHRFHKTCYDLVEKSKEILEQQNKEQEENKKFECTKLLIQAQVTKRLRDAEQTSKAKTALKVQLMMLKSKAIGEKSIPSTDRVYLGIKLPIDSSGKEIKTTSDGINVISNVRNDAMKPVFISKTWSIGRAIDSICNLLSIKNENNITCAPKLRLFRESDGMCVNIMEMDQSVKTLLDNYTIIDGEKLFLEYISIHCITKAEKNTAYFLNYK